MKPLLALLAALAMAGCVPVSEIAPDKTVQVLEKAGYSEITTGKYRLFACPKEDIYATEFTATGPSGQQVSGVVCQSVIGGSLIRID